MSVWFCSPTLTLALYWCMYGVCIVHSRPQTHHRRRKMSQKGEKKPHLSLSLRRNSLYKRISLPHICPYRYRKSACICSVVCKECGFVCGVISGQSLLVRVHVRACVCVCVAVLFHVCCETNRTCAAARPSAALTFVNALFEDVCSLPHHITETPVLLHAGCVRAVVQPSL